MRQRGTELMPIEYPGQRIAAGLFGQVAHAVFRFVGMPARFGHVLQFAQATQHRQFTRLLEDHLDVLGLRHADVEQGFQFR